MQVFAKTVTLIILCLNLYMSNSGTCRLCNRTQSHHNANNSQLDIAKTDNLSFQEITKITSINSACISAVISLVKILEKTLKKHDDDPGVRTMKAEMLKSRQQILDNIEEIDKRYIANILNPPFKDKYFTKQSQSS